MPTGSVLIVDDSEIVLEVSRTALEDAGLVVNTLDNPLELSRTILKEKPDLILLDVRMPGLPGVEALRFLKRYSGSRQIPVVLHSDLEEKELAELVEREGAAGFIKKTPDRENFVTQVVVWLELSRNTARM